MEVGDHAMVAAAYTHLESCYMYLGQYDRAHEMQQEVVAMAAPARVPNPLVFLYSPVARLFETNPVPAGEPGTQW